MWLIERRDWNPFIRKTCDPRPVQEALLRRILARQSETTFGRQHRFQALRTFDEYRRAVPIQCYEDLRPYIEGQERTREPRLNADPPLLYAQTSGTTGKPKLIPILRDTARGIRFYQRLFAFAQYQGVPAIYHGKTLVIAGATIEGHLPTGIGYGAMSGVITDSLPWAVRRKSSLSDAVRGIADYGQKYRHIAACALAEPSLSVLATPNPSTILKLLEVIRRDYPDLVEALSSRCDLPGAAGVLPPAVSPERLSHLRALIGQEASLTLASLWPSLRAVVTWTGGNCALLIPKLRALLPEGAVIIEMGYLSSECLGSLNVDVVHNRCVPTFHEHLFEFVEAHHWERDQPATVTLEQLEVGRKYSVIVTTSNGLYRYAMNDIVEVTGRFNQTPTIRFVQKGKGVTNITGEKIYEHQVIQAVEEVAKSVGASCEFFMMLAGVDECQYRLYLEPPPDEPFLDQRIDERLAELNIEYRSKRESGRLQPLRLSMLRPGTGDAYKQYCLRNGQRDAQFKLVRLQYSHECSFDFTFHVR
jgi:phenylacetate-coenzyme A ligase PaaK-like adenylate-forming protein